MYRFVEVKLGERTVYIHKTTAVWLLQEGERVSLDRLFRVRAKQPFSTFGKSTSKIMSIDSTIPTSCNIVEVDEVCVFMFKADHTTNMNGDMDWKIGRILHFINYLEKTKTAQQYRGMCANTDNKKIGVLCSWYTPSDNSTREYSIMPDVSEARSEKMKLFMVICHSVHICAHYQLGALNYPKVQMFQMA